MIVDPLTVGTFIVTLLQGANRNLNKTRLTNYTSGLSPETHFHAPGNSNQYSKKMEELNKSLSIRRGRATLWVLPPHHPVR